MRGDESSDTRPDPYPGAGRAHGLAFSVRCGVAKPLTLKNIHEEFHDDLRLPIPDHGNLEPWAHHGVLLLNTALTVSEGAPGPHQKAWKPFTEAIIEVVTIEKNPVFILWGEQAQLREELVRRSAGSDAKIIKSSHPSPLSAHRPCGDSPPFVGSKPFSHANDLLGSSGRGEIDWNLEP